MNLMVIDAYHDAELKSVDCRDSACLVLQLALRDGLSRVLMLHKPQIFRITDFVSQNVVSRLHIISGEQVDEDFVVENLTWASRQRDFASFLQVQVIEDILEKIKQRERSLLVIEPSWGAEVVVLFAHMSENTY